MSSTGVDISVIMPVFNVEQYLPECLDSVIEQGGCRIEIIAIDDCSTDKSLDVLYRYKKEHETSDNIQFTIIALKENKGPGVARNAAIKKARGAYTFFIDSDDIIKPNTFKTLIKTAKENLADIVIFPYTLWRDTTLSESGMFPNDKEILKTSLNGREYRNLQLKDAPRLLVMNNYPWNKLYSTPFLHDKNITFSDVRLNEDIYIHWQSLLFAEKITVFDQVIYTHRLFQSGQQQVTNCFDERRFDLFTVLMEVDALIHNHPRFMKEFYPYFLLFKIEILRWARDRMPEELLDTFNQKVENSMELFSRKDYLLGANAMPNVYSEMLKIKLKIHPGFASSFI
jgi:glycosyltransferase involved in cell wall biosynthesis